MILQKLDAREYLEEALLQFQGSSPDGYLENHF